MFKLKQTAVSAAVLALTLGASFAARADGDVVPSAATQLTSVKDSLGAYSTIMFGIALIATGIMVGVKWIKRGKGAA